ncbi:Calx-beta domain-containing protein [Sunxiuqinia elliptica]
MKVLSLQHLVLGITKNILAIAFLFAGSLSFGQTTENYDGAGTANNQVLANGFAAFNYGEFTYQIVSFNGSNSSLLEILNWETYGNNGTDAIGVVGDENNKITVFKLTKTDGSAFSTSSLWMTSAGDSYTITGYNDGNTTGQSVSVSASFSGIKTLNFTGVDELWFEGTEIIVDLDDFTYTLGATNSAPTATAPSAPTVSEDDTNVALANDIQVADTDGDNQTVTFTITGGTLTIGTTGITFDGSGNGNASFTAEGTLAAINTALDAATFTPTPNLSGSNVATISFTTNDGNVSSTAASVTFNITEVNDDPTISGLPTDITVTEDIASNVDLSAATFGDVDAGSNSIALKLTVGAGTLTASSGGGVTVGGSGTSILTLTGTASNIDTYLNTASNIKYTGASNVNGNDAATLSLTANDGGNTGSGGGTDVALGTLNVDIAAVNDAPTVSNRTFTDIHKGIAYPNIGNIAIDYGDMEGDNLQNIRISSLPGNGVLFLDPNNNGDIDDGEAIVVNQLISRDHINWGYLQYLNTDGVSSSFTYEASDGIDYSNTATVTLTVKPAPTVTFTNISQTINESTATITITARLSEAINYAEVSVPFTVNGSSTATGAGEDYSIAGNPITIIAGLSSNTINISVIDDDLAEQDETVVIDMGEPTNADKGANTTFTATIQDNDDAPTVSTQPVSSIKATTATGNGNISSLGTSPVTQHGCCWNTTGSPSLSDSKSEEGSASQTGAFTTEITGLAPGTTYYVRAYATSAAGTSYGQSFLCITNKLPTLSINDIPVSYTENGAATPIDGAATLTDEDGNSEWNGGSLTVQITGNNEPGDEISIFDNDGASPAITISGTNIFSDGTDVGDLSEPSGTVTNGTPLTITFDADATNTIVQEVLQSICYRSTSDNPGTSDRTITFIATDRKSDSASDTRAVSVTAVNDDPAISGLPTDITVSEDIASNVDLSAATFNDVDAGANSIVLTIAASTGTLTASSGGSVTIGGSGTGTLSLTGAAADINTYLNTTSNIKYTGATNVNGNDAATLTLTANDGGNTGSGGGTDVSLGTVNIDITAINDDPTISGLPTIINVLEDIASNVNLSAATFNDVDAGANSIVLTIAASTGTLSASSGGSVTIAGSGTGTLSLTGAEADIDTYLNTASNIKYTGATNVNGNDAATLTLTANDGGNTGSGSGTDVSLGTVNVDITAVNDKPTASDFTKAIYEGTPYVFAIGDFGYSDVDDDALVKITFNWVPENGILYIDADNGEDYDAGEELANGANVSKSNLDNGNLQYLNTDGISSYFEFVVNDGSTYSASINTATLTVSSAPTVTLSLDPSSSIAESSGTTNVKATISNSFNKDVTVNLLISGTAKGSGTDYTLPASSIVILAGNTSNSIQLSSVSDDLDEDDETVIIDISTVINGSESGTQQVTATILDNDVAPTIEFIATSSSGAESVSSKDLQVDLSAVSGLNVSVDYAVTGTATGGGTDYTLANGTLTISAGSVSDNITIASIINDLLDENDETVIVTLSNPVNATLGTNTVHTYTILDDDVAPTIEFIATSSSGAESVSSKDLQVDLSAVSGLNVSVDYAVTGTATGDGTDYTLANGTLTISAGSVSDNITIASIINDLLDENDETVIVTLSNPVNATLGTNNVHTYTIDDDDVSPTVAFTSASQSSSNESGSLTITAQISEISGRDISVPFTINSNSTATGGGTDYSITPSPLTILSGSAFADIIITIASDDIVEGNETVIVNMGTPINALISGESTHTATITDDDVAGFTIAESEGNTSVAESGTTDSFSVVLKAQPVSDVVLNVTSGETREATVDKTSLTFTSANWDTPQTVTVTGMDDDLDDGDQINLITISIDTTGSDDDFDGVANQTVNVTTTDDDVLPTITTQAVTSITSTTATANGNISGLGVPNPTAHGVCWSSSENPTTADNKEDKGAASTTGAFSASLTSLNPNTTYYVRAFATNSAGTVYGTQVSFTTLKKSQNITFSQLTDRTYGDADFNLTATASSGLPVSYSSSNTSVATIAGNTVTILGAGSTTITASQAGNATYNSATNVVRTLSVNKASQSIDFSLPGSITIDEGSVALVASSTSGLSVIFSSSDEEVATIDKNTLNLVTPGVVNIKANQTGNNNYHPAPEVTIQLEVLPSVNQAPVFENQTVSLLENSPAETLVLELQAEDPDNDTITFSILEGNDNEAFKAEANQLLVNNSDALDLEDHPVFELTVRADDGQAHTDAIITIQLEEDPSVGIDPELSVQFTLAPNPCSDFLRLTFANPIYGEAQLAVYSLKGEKVISKSFNLKEYQTLNVSKLTPGVYILIIHQDQLVIRKRWIKI